MHVSYKNHQIWLKYRHRKHYAQIFIIVTKLNIYTVCQSSKTLLYLGLRHILILKFYKNPFKSSLRQSFSLFSVHFITM